MSEGWYSNSVVYDKNKGGEIMYKSTPDSLVQFISGTTIAPLADIYYGQISGGSTTLLPTSYQIKTLFSTSDGYVGGYSTPKTYTFHYSTNECIFFCWPDVPSGSTYGNRALNLVRRTSGTNVLGTNANSVYKYRQLLPPTVAISPDGSPATIYYAKVTIDGIVYRVWKSSAYYTYYDNINVYSIND
jgi:hypothetical protein